MIEFRPTGSRVDILKNYERLFNICFPSTKKFQLSYLDWLYQRNPDGLVVGFDAWDGERLAAHYACIPAQADIAGIKKKVLLSLNTATHPNYQGKGLFTKLAELTYDTGRDLGYDAVYGVANANSTHGFIRKLNFQLVQPLFARIGIRSLSIDFDKVIGSAQFRRLWTDESLTWRCSNPVNPVIIKVRDLGIELSTCAAGGALSLSTELNFKSGLRSDHRILSPFRLYIGLVPTGACAFSGYFDIPMWLRPSPLNFIYRPLSGCVHRIAPGSVFFSFIDFDAY